MGNENSATEIVNISRRSYYNERRRKSYNQSGNLSYRLDSPQRSLNVLPDVSERQQEQSDMPADPAELDNYREVRLISRREAPTVSESRDIGDNPDRVLERLNKKNEELRRELRDISQMLSEKLEKRKIVVKKRYETVEQNDAAATKAQHRELENAYKQIDMYKRQIQELKSKQEGEKGFIKVDNLENEISTKDREIEQLTNDIKAHTNIKKGQEKVISKDLNEDQLQMIKSYKDQIDNLKTKLKEISKRDRVREENYKRQHAYLCELERLKMLKEKEEISRRAGASVSLSTSSSPTKRRIVSDAQSNNSTQKKTLPSSKEFNILKEQLAEIKKKHDEYHKKIDGIILLKNKNTQEKSSVENVLKQKMRVIDGLKLKVEELKKLGKVRQKNLFGGDGSTLNAESALDGAEKQDRQLSPEPSDAFNIDHLIANIPRPNRSVRRSSMGSEGGALNLQLYPAGSRDTSRNQVKVWNSSKNRRQVKGDQARGQLKFDDKPIFQEESEPKMVGFNVWMTQQEDITAIQAIYILKGQIMQGYKSSNPNGNLFHFDLKVPDYVKSITGGIATNGALEYIVFVSKSGKIGRFGKVNETARPISFDLLEGQRPYLLSGASRLFGSEVRITRIGIDICKDA